MCADRAFAVYAVTKFLMALGLFVPAILLVNYAKDAGVPDADAAFLLSVVGFVDIVARPACGALAGLARLRPRVADLFSLALLANGLADLSSARARSHGALVAFCVAFGLSYGMVGALQFEVLMAAVGAPRFPSALGLVLLIEAVAVLIGPPSAGAPFRRGCALQEGVAQPSAPEPQGSPLPVKWNLQGWPVRGDRWWVGTPSRGLLALLPARATSSGWGWKSARKHQH